MLNRSKLVAFVATANADKAKDFYKNTLGLDLREDTPFALVFNANGVALRVQKVNTVTNPSGTALGWEVADISATVKWLLERGVKCERFPGMEQDGLGIWQSPAGSQIAWFKDPDGNILSIGQHARS